MVQGKLIKEFKRNESREGKRNKTTEAIFYFIFRIRKVIRLQDIPPSVILTSKENHKNIDNAEELC